MSAHLNASASSTPAPIAGDPFLGTVIRVMDRLCSESELRGYSLLSNLLEIARAEAEDNLRTYGRKKLRAGQAHNSSEDAEDNEGARRIAAKFAWRATKKMKRQRQNMGGDEDAKPAHRSASVGGEVQ